MKWSEQTWEIVNPIYNQILDLPFNQELSDGTLDKEKFKFYMAQDAYYLGEFGKALSTISGRLKNLDQVLAFSQFASGAIVVERALHEGYFRTLGIPEEVKPSPTCLLYTNYLLSQAAYSNVEVSVAAVLPCFWIYKKVGDHIYSQQETENLNPYKNWIDTYAGKEFSNSVNQVINIADDLAEKASNALKAQMHDAFEMATKLEWMFWDSAYKQEKWAI
jgi:thiaminase/transcriptional activator TenA